MRGLLVGTSDTVEGDELPICQDLAPLVISSHPTQSFKIDGYMCQSSISKPWIRWLTMSNEANSWHMGNQQVFHESLDIIDPTNKQLDLYFCCSFLIQALDGHPQLTILERGMTWIKATLTNHIEWMG